MNKLIPKLLDQAGLKPEIMLDDSSREVECFVTKYDGSVPSIENYTKFAELIVKECVGVAVEQKQWVENQQPTFNYDDDRWDRARIQQSERIIEKIREHFGVEE